MARTQLFLIACVIPFDRLRFRQHQSEEMAHYAKDCWDAEIRSSYGWIEICGHADRLAYDLESHSKATCADLTAIETFTEPQVVDAVEIEKDAQKKVVCYLEKLEKSIPEAKNFEEALKKGAVKIPGVGVDLEAKFIKSIKLFKKTVYTRRYAPHVIEPSFGLGRIFYSVLENSYYVRDTADSQRIRKCEQSPFFHSTDEKLCADGVTLARLFIQQGLSNKLDASSVTSGRKYARTDEIGIPYVVTIDGTADGTVTLRERDTTRQVRIAFTAVVFVVHQLVQGLKSWDQVLTEFPEQVRNDKEDGSCTKKKKTKTSKEAKKLEAAPAKLATNINIKENEKKEKALKLNHQSRLYHRRSRCTNEERNYSQYREKKFKKKTKTKRFFCRADGD